MSSDLPTPLLISVADLSRHLQADDWLVVDCRFDLAHPQAGEGSYRAGHAPGAVYAHLDRDLSSPKTPASGRHPLPHPATLVTLLSGWGVHAGVQVVAYDDAGGAIAARFWWLLRWLGHRRVALLDGGWQAWTAAGLRVSKSRPHRRPAIFPAAPDQMPTADAIEIERRLGEQRLLIIDARARARYLGEMEPIDPVAGHIPGAVNVPYQHSLGETGGFRDADSLKKELHRVLAGRDMADVVAMCGSGVTACHAIFAMELAGFPGARLYPGSWSEWIADPRRPVGRG